MSKIFYFQLKFKRRRVQDSERIQGSNVLRHVSEFCNRLVKDVK